MELSISWNNFLKTSFVEASILLNNVIDFQMIKIKCPYAKIIPIEVQTKINFNKTVIQSHGIRVHKAETHLLKFISMEPSSFIKLKLTLMKESF